MIIDFAFFLSMQASPSPSLFILDGIHCSTIVGNTVWAGCQDGTIGIWHIRTGELVGVRQAHRAKIFAMHLGIVFIFYVMNEGVMKKKQRHNSM